MTCICEPPSMQEEPPEAGRALDEMLEHITVRRVALERSLALAATTLYPELWREITHLRRQDQEQQTQIAWLLAENDRLRARAGETDPTVPLQAVPAHTETGAAERSHRSRRSRGVPLMPGRRT